MNRDEAFEALELAPSSTPAERAAQSEALRRQLEDKLAKAPTPGLREKYRRNLRQLEEAFALLSQTDDSSALPVLQKQGAGSKEQGAPANSPVGSPSETVSQSNRLAATSATRSAQAPTLHSKSKSGSKEFLVVALIAVAALAAGGWFVLKARAENEAKARVAAAAQAEAERQAAATKAEAERKAEEARLAAEHQRKAEEAERNRLAAAEKAEQARKDAIITRLRTELAEARIIWESIQKEERNAERALNDYRSEARSLQRDGPAARYHELVARAITTQRYLGWLNANLERHPAHIARAKLEELVSARQADEALKLMPELQNQLALLQSEVTAQKALADRIEGELEIDSAPSGLDFEFTDAFGHRRSGRTPARYSSVSPGPAAITARRPGYQPVTVTVPVDTGATAQALVEVVSETVTVMSEPDVEIWSNNRLLGRGQVALVDHAPNSYVIELRRQGSPSFHTKVEVKQGRGARIVPYNFTDLSAQKHVCDRCNGERRIEEQQTCRSCGGWGRYDNGRGSRCLTCKGAQNVWVWVTCLRCGGDGRLSDIDLSRR